MRFVFFGYDMMLPSLVALTQAGHEVMAVYTFPCDGVFTFNTDIAKFASCSPPLQRGGLGGGENVPVFYTAPTAQDISDWEDKGAQVFVIAGYPWRVPVPGRTVGINIHPSLLPLGRGIMPLPHIILNAPQAAGVSIHILEYGFDTGPVLIQRALPLAANEDVDTLGARAALAAPDLVMEIFQDLQGSIARAVSQDPAKATWFPLPDAAMRHIDWTAPMEQILAKVRAFGRFGATACVEGQTLIIVRAYGWRQDHAIAPGTLVQTSGPDLVVAIQEGFIYIYAPRLSEIPV